MLIDISGTNGDILNAAGLLGVAIILLAYFLFQTEKVAKDDIKYLLLNLIGSFLMMISLLGFFNLASFILQLSWIAITIHSIYKKVRKNAGS